MTILVLTRCHAIVLFRIRFLFTTGQLSLYKQEVAKLIRMEWMNQFQYNLHVLVSTIVMVKTLVENGIIMYTVPFILSSLEQVIAAMVNYRIINCSRSTVSDGLTH